MHRAKLLSVLAALSSWIPPAACTTWNDVRVRMPLRPPCSQETRETREDRGTDPRLRGQVDVIVGWRKLTDNFWRREDSHLVEGFQMVVGHEDHPFGLDFGFLYSFSGTGSDRVIMFDAYLGPRVTFRRDTDFRPYLGTGLGFSLVDADGGALVVSTPGDDDDLSFAGFVHGGFLYDITKHVHLGVDVRYQFGTDVDLFGSSADIDYLQVAGVVGFHF